MPAREYMVGDRANMHTIVIGSNLKICHPSALIRIFACARSRSTSSAARLRSSGSTNPSSANRETDYNILRVTINSFRIQSVRVEVNAREPPFHLQEALKESN